MRPSRHRSRVALRGWHLLLVLAWAEDAAAWNYEEHRKLAHDAFLLACEAAQPHSPRLARICGAQRIRQCYSHMVALAGDHVEFPDRLAATKQDGALLVNARHGVECRGLAIETNDDSGDFAKVGKLNHYGLRGFWSYIRLLPDNRAHFQPQAPQQWEHYLRLSLRSDARDLQRVLALHAFSSHYLQDAFSAGHNGIDRGRRKQDYDQAYHDDLNSTGLFLKNARGDAWHSYGDKYLDTPSRFLLSDYCTGRQQHLGRDLEALTGRKLHEFPASAQQLLCDSDDPSVLTLAQRRWTLWHPCFYWDNCEKTEVVYADEAIAEFMTGCHPDGESVLVECESTREYVTEAMTRQVALLLRHLDGEQRGYDQLEYRIHQIGTWIPSAYRAVKYQEGGELFINKQSFLLTYTDWNELADVGRYRPLAFRNWTASLYSAIADHETLRDTTLSWSLMMKGSDGPRMAWPDWLAERSRLELRFDIVSDDGNFADGAEINVGVEVLRPLQHVAGIALTAALGVDDAWGGRVDRNWYYGGGIEFNAHIGRNIVFLGVQSLEHSNRRFTPDDSLRIHLGWRVSSVALSR